MALTKQISRRSLILTPTNAEVSTAQTISPYYDFIIDGVLTIPATDTYDAARYIDAAQDFFSAKISVGVGGTSQYRIKVTSYDSAGANPVEHINALSAFTTANAITSLSFSQASVAAERTIVMSVAEEIVGTSCEDLSLTIVSGTFGDLEFINPGHIVEDDSAVFTQREKLQFIGDEVAVTDDAGNNRSVITILAHPIGGTYRADISLVQFQAQMGTNWILANGQSSVGTAYETLTTNTVVPNITDPDGLLVFIKVD